MLGLLIEKFLFGKVVCQLFKIKEHYSICGGFKKSQGKNLVALAAAFRILSFSNYMLLQQDLRFSRR
jgi:hypothetical protein